MGLLRHRSFCGHGRCFLRPLANYRRLPLMNYMRLSLMSDTRLFIITGSYLFSLLSGLGIRVSGGRLNV